MRRLALSLIVLGACGGPAAAPVGPVTVRTGSALLVAVDPDGSGAWRRLGPDTEQTIEMGARWMAASVCGSAGNIDVVVQAYGIDDGTDIALPCRPPDGEVVPVAATATGTSDASIDLGAYGGGNVTNGAGTLYAYPGTWDLFAMDEPSTFSTPRALIQRDVVVAPGAAVAVDFDVDGFELEARAVTTSGAIGSTSASTTLVLRSETYPSRFVAAAASGTWVVPPARLIDGDVQRTRVISNRGDGYGVFADAAVGAGAITASLPAPLAAASVTDDGGLSGTWQNDGRWEVASLTAFVSGAGTRLGWFFDDPEVGGGAIGCPDLTTIPGWDASWNLPAGGPRNLGISVSRATDAGFEGASFGVTLAR